MTRRKRRREDKMYQIGVDIGGTNIKVGLVNETMELVQTCCGSRRLRGRT